MKIIKGWVKKAKYFKENGSILIHLEELESRKNLKPIQISVNTFKKIGIPVKEDDHDAWIYFASQLEKRKDPLSIEFEGTKNKDDII